MMTLIICRILYQQPSKVLQPQSVPRAQMGRLLDLVERLPASAALESISVRAGRARDRCRLRLLLRAELIKRACVRRGALARLEFGVAGP